MMTPDIFSSRHTSMTSSNEAFLNSSSEKSNFDRFIEAVREAFERLSVYMGLVKKSVPLPSKLAADLSYPDAQLVLQGMLESSLVADHVEEAVKLAKGAKLPEDLEL
jgi:hypothetical protein